MNKVVAKLKTFDKGAWTKFITAALAVLFAVFSIVYFAVQTEWDDMALSFASIVYSLAPFIIERLFRFRVQPVLYIFVIAYTVCPLLGSSYQLYLKFSWWDDMLHGFAGLIFAVFGAYLPRTKRGKCASKGVTMKPIDIIIITLAVAVVVGVIALSVWRKKKGKTGCGCGCNGCSGCSSKTACAVAKKAEEELQDE